MNKRSFLIATLAPVVLLNAACAATSAPDRNARRTSIDADIDNALAVLFDRTKRSL